MKLFACIPWRLTGTVAALTVLSGCASTTPQYDARFGDAVRHNRQAQVLDPAAGSGKAEPAALDAGSARSAFQRYRDSFKTPPPVVNVINLGGSGGQSP
jgi:type IV pilus biogenesis protein CpaD/CtpE